MPGVSGSHLLELFDDVQDLIFIHDMEGRISYINNYILKLLG
jgi:PAS domain-containing protein